MKWYSLIALCFLTMAVHAQTMHGTVIDAFSRKPLALVSIVNKTTGATSISAENGAYSISGSIGELVQFSFLGYETVSVLIPKSGDLLAKTISMEPSDYQLKEFVFREKLTPYQRDSIYRKEVYQKSLDYKKSSVASPFSFLAETISGKAKHMKAFKNDFAYWDQQQFINTRYRPDVVQGETGLKGDTLTYFMNLYPMPHEYARAASTIEIKMWIRDNYKDWKKKGAPYLSTQFADSILKIK